LNLYAEAIAKMPENPGIPLLFRDIFKNAYLPYRDPETLRAFLKVIDEFTYDHSERLGDAFEYLLSVLGSQGDAGQFRTPRHIIDFMVEIIDPKKTETVLDPACGTAGFLISSYKHILRNNSSNPSPRPSPSGRGRSAAEGEGVAYGDLLTPDEKGRLAQNFKGYDISPDMVRLSLVNLYLHGFADPHIAEYDTLTSQEKWNEYADVILANPPFMSPKGGIKPHNRFSVQSKRSEVLFVDYMAEHLTPSGRAGIIVPEGIIFQSQTAYKQLRKMLVEEYLVAVVSLPAGVFNPYSGVKTSILILDKTLARKTNTIAFFKIENDGFGLGAQRREIDKNDLPQAHADISDYLRRLRAGESVADFQPTLGLIVEKEKIAANGDYNLSGERYGETSRARFSDYAFRKLGDLCVIRTGKKDVNSGNENGRYPFFTCARKHTYSDEYSFDTEAILIAGNGDVGSVQYYSGKFEAYQRTYVLSDWIGVEGRYLYFLLNDRLKETVSKLKLGNTMPYIKLGMLIDFEIPLPPLEAQKEIVAEIEGYQKIINGARAVLDNYRPHIPIHPDWPMVELGKACETIMDGTHFSPSNTETGDRLYITSKNVRENYLELSNVSYISEDDHRAIYSRCPVRTGDVLYIKDGANTGLAAINTLTEEFSLLSSVAVMRGKPEMLSNRYLAFFLNSERGRQSMLSMISGVAITRLTLTKLNSALIPLPPLATQQAIVAEIEAEQALVAANRELIARFEKKIQSTLARVWGEGKPAPAEA
ncbi:MAG: N-6 DNA methylase, partial [bacterium]